MSAQDGRSGDEAGSPPPSTGEGGLGAPARSPRAYDRVSDGTWHRCPACGVADTRETLHCVGGQYRGCCRSFSSLAAFDTCHPADEGIVKHLDPVTRVRKGTGQPRLVARPSSTDGHDVWGQPGTYVPEASR